MWQPMGDGNPMAAFLNGRHKYVVSSTLEELTWGPAVLGPGGADLADRIRALTEQSGGTIQVPAAPGLSAGS
jgi:hypothetical protein